MSLTSQAPSVRPPRAANLLLIVSVVLSMAFGALTALTLWQARHDAWSKAEVASRNLAVALVGEIERSLDLYRFILQDLVDDLDDPAVQDDPEADQRFLRRGSQMANAIGAILRLDAEGDIVSDAEVGGRTGNFADRDYFRVQRDNPDAGLYISDPYESRLRAGDPSIGLSMRMTDSNDRFDGIVLVAVRLDFFRALFARFDVGEGGDLVLLKDNGTILVREPSADGAGDVGRDITASPNFQRMTAPAGTFEGISQIDGVSRLYSYVRVPETPLIVSVGISTEGVLAPWRSRALVTGGLVAVLCIGGVLMAFLARREMIRRAQVETDLAFLSITDGLTGLANRRRFDEMLERELRRTRRTGGSLALLVIDADRFKQLNDRFGHARGDEVLKTIARVLEECTRHPGDIAARIGGEEFAAVLPDVHGAAAMEIAQRIRTRLEELASPETEDAPASTTVSIGVAFARATDARPVEALLAAADRALYRAKERGRNTVVAEDDVAA